MESVLVLAMSLALHEIPVCQGQQDYLLQVELSLLIDFTFISHSHLPVPSPIAAEGAAEMNL